jgi:nitrate/nitrite-specific signal transduction histidine kinase
MEPQTDYWSWSTKKLIEHMHPGNMQAGSDQWVYLSNILNHKLAEENTQSTKRLVLATWAIAITTFLLVVVTIFKK